MKTWMNVALSLSLLLGVGTVPARADTPPGQAVQASVLMQLFGILTPEQQALATQLRLEPAQVTHLEALYGELGVNFFRRDRQKTSDPILHPRAQAVLNPAQQELLARMQLQPEQTARLVTALPQLASRPVLVDSSPPRAIPVVPVVVEPEDDSAMAAAMLDLVKLFVHQARENKLEGLKPSKEQVQGALSGLITLKDAGEAYQLANDVLREVRFSPEQTARLKSFRLTGDQGLQLLEMVLDKGPELVARGGSREQFLARLAPDVAGILSREQMATLSGLNLSPRQMEALGTVLASRGLPLLESMSRRLQGVAGGVSALKLGLAQADWLKLIMQLLQSR